MKEDCIRVTEPISISGSTGQDHRLEIWSSSQKLWPNTMNQLTDDRVSVMSYHTLVSVPSISVHGLIVELEPLGGHQNCLAPQCLQGRPGLAARRRPLQSWRPVGSRWDCPSERWKTDCQVGSEQMEKNRSSTRKRSHTLPGCDQKLQSHDSRYSHVL